MVQFFELERVNPFQPKKLYHMKNRIKSMMPNGITGLESVKYFVMGVDGEVEVQLHTEVL
jgi:hypothetical protein